MKRSVIIAHLLEAANILSAEDKTKKVPKVKWKKVDPKILIGEASAPIGERMTNLVFRIDVRGSKIRVDRGSMMGWEAIDGGDGVANVTKGKALVQQWLAAAIEQETVTPNIGL